MGGVFEVPLDLHCHTKVSDGSTGVDELIFVAKRMGIRNLAITDHDTFAGAKRGIIIGNRFGVNILLGAELSSFSDELKKEIHILCYMCDYPDRLEGICSANSKVRKDTIGSMIEIVSKHYPVSSVMIGLKSRGSSGIFKNHIVQAVMDSGYILPIYSIAYKKIFSLEQISSIQAKYCEPADVIDKIHQSGGIAVLAHPSESDVDDVIPMLIDLGIDGIETYHPSISTEHCEKLKSIASRFDLLTTGGSDFHGMYSPGMRNLNSFSTPDDVFKEMLYRKNEIMRKIR